MALRVPQGGATRHGPRRRAAYANGSGVLLMRSIVPHASVSPLRASLSERKLWERTPDSAAVRLDEAVKEMCRSRSSTVMGPWLGSSSREMASASERSGWSCARRRGLQLGLSSSLYERRKFLRATGKTASHRR